MKIGFIGAGKVGTSLGIHFAKHDLPISGYVSRTKESSEMAADLTGSTAFYNVEDFLAETDVVFLTTPDESIPKLAEELAGKLSPEQVLCHASGSLSSNVLRVATRNVAGAHPMMAVSGNNTDMTGAFFTIEGDDEAANLLHDLLIICGNSTSRIDSNKKMQYHCAAAFASNLVVGLVAISKEMLCECGFDEGEAGELLTPLIRQNVEAICDKGAVEALTGPVERGDAKTVQGHLDALEGDEDNREIYRLISERLVRLAREKNPNRNYEALSNILEEKEQ